MANEATVRISVSVRKRSGSLTLIDERHSASYFEDVSGTAGPVPGSIAVTEVGVNLDLSALTTPGLCYLHNQGDYPINWGVMDPETGRFYALGTISPGKGAFPGKLYQFLGEYEIEGTGTGSFSSTYYMHFKAVGGASRLLAGVFEA